MNPRDQVEIIEQLTKAISTTEQDWITSDAAREIDRIISDHDAEDALRNLRHAARTLGRSSGSSDTDDVSDTAEAQELRSATQSAIDAIRDELDIDPSDDDDPTPDGGGGADAEAIERILRSKIKQAERATREIRSIDATPKSKFDAVQMHGSWAQRDGVMRAHQIEQQQLVPELTALLGDLRSQVDAIEAKTRATANRAEGEKLAATLDAIAERAQQLLAERS